MRKRVIHTVEILILLGIMGIGSIAKTQYAPVLPFVSGLIAMLAAIRTSGFSIRPLLKPHQTNPERRINEDRLFLGIQSVAEMTLVLLAAALGLVANWLLIKLGLRWLLLVQSFGGFLVIFVGAFCHRGAVSQLGDRWVDGIETLKNHRIEITSWYSLVRHPIYLGIGLVKVGTLASVGGPIAAILFGMFLFLAQWRRAALEECLLTSENPSAYGKYQITTPTMLVPRKSALKPFFTMVAREFLRWY